jgi:hypothetical protein
MTDKPIRGEAKRVYDELRQDLIRLHANWQIYKQLFTVSEERYEILNSTAPGFFRLIQDVLVDNAVVSLSRLTDPARFTSFARLVKELKGQVDHSFLESLRADLAALQSACEDIRQHRHKRVAHKVARGAPPQVTNTPDRLPTLTRKKIEGSISAMAAFMNKVLGQFESVEQLFDPIVRGDAEALVFFLQEGLRATSSPDWTAYPVSISPKSA